MSDSHSNLYGVIFDSHFPVKKLKLRRVNDFLKDSYMVPKRKKKSCGMELVKTGFTDVWWEQSKTLVGWAEGALYGVSSIQSLQTHPRQWDHLQLLEIIPDFL